MNGFHSDGRGMSAQLSAEHDNEEGGELDGREDHWVAVPKCELGGWITAVTPRLDRCATLLPQ